MAGMRILIADDNATMRAMLEKQVEMLGAFEMDFAGNGNEALRLYRQKHHDLLIIDNFMPLLNGVDVLRELRSDPLLDQTHVIMITSQVNKELVTIIRSEMLKIDDLVVKPVDLVKFRNKIADVATRIRRKSRRDGPILKEADPILDQMIQAPTLFCEVIDRGNIAIVELKGRLENANKSVISQLMKQLQTIFAPTVVIDINAIEEIDEFGVGTLAVMSGWLTINGMDSYLSFDDCAKKDTLTSLGITHLIPMYHTENA